eukprot:3719085-Prymnesium_polylepis.1
MWRSVAAGPTEVSPSSRSRVQNDVGMTASPSSTFDFTRDAFVVLRATETTSLKRKENWTHAAAGLMSYSAQIALKRSRQANLSGCRSREARVEHGRVDHVHALSVGGARRRQLLRLGQLAEEMCLSRQSCGDGATAPQCAPACRAS